MNPFERIIKINGLKYQIYRDDILINECIGLPNTEKSTNRKYVGFHIGTDIQPNDLVINPVGEKRYIVEVETKFIKGEPLCLNAYTSNINAEHSTKTQNITFNLNDVHDSIIGTQGNVVINKNTSIKEISELIEHNATKDKEVLMEMLQVIEKAFSSEEPVKKGFLSKFSKKLQENEWLTSPLATLALQFFLSQG